MPSSTRPLRVKISLVGDSSSGKTSLLYAFLKNRFLNLFESDNTFFESPYVTDMKLDGLSVCFYKLTLKTKTYFQTAGKKKVELILWDTSGQDYYERLRSLNYPETNVILICYSIDNYDSFQSVAHKWLQELTGLFPHTPVILVGKSYLRDYCWYLNLD